jgi:hypothetical protein
MTKAEKQVLIETLQITIKKTDQMWNEGRSHAFIVGYLQGAIKAIIAELNTNDIRPTK